MNHPRGVGKRLAAVCAVGLLTLGGCGKGRPELGQVAGRVTLDGKPLAGAVVMFFPLAGGRTASGTTDAQGEYRLTTFGPDDGALLGAAAVTISKQVVTGATADDHGLSGPPVPGSIHTQSVLPERLAWPKESGLTADVKPGKNRCDFEL